LVLGDPRSAKFPVKESDLMHRVRITDPEKDWSGVRETIIWILFCFILAAGAFGWGYIYKDHRVDDLREQVHKQEGKQMDMDGRLTALEGKRK
jgi:hypothetical protein